MEVRTIALMLDTNHRYVLTYQEGQGTKLRNRTCLGCLSAMVRVEAVLG